MFREIFSVDFCFKISFQNSYFTSLLPALTGIIPFNFCLSVVRSSTSLSHDDKSSSDSVVILQGPGGQVPRRKRNRSPSSRDDLPARRTTRREEGQALQSFPGEC